jgi:hypothetical protein
MTDAVSPAGDLLRETGIVLSQKKIKGGNPSDLHYK